VIEKYPQLTEDEVKTLVVDDKWLPTIKGQIDGEVEAISRSLTQRVNELAGQYEKAVVEIDEEVDELETRVQSHLEAMGITQFESRIRWITQITRIFYYNPCNPSIRA
jgi:type I restriction enzyme M protein